MLATSKLNSIESKISEALINNEIGHEKINPRVSKTSNGKAMLLSKCATCFASKKSRFIKKQDAKGIISSLGLKTLLNKIPLLGDILF